MTWIYYPHFFYITAVSWAISLGLMFAPRDSKWVKTGFWMGVVGLAVLSVFAAKLWIALARPPMRTLGETRLWYSLFLPAIGMLGFAKWKFRWFMQYSVALSLVFLTINMLNPETYDKTLMPALQSVWFVPHVVVYIFAYALLAASSMVAVSGLRQLYRSRYDTEVLKLADTITYYGFAFLTLGLVFGALWAKAAWGDFWTWDPKETWAFVTWMGYLIYIHVRFHKPQSHKTALWILALSFVVLLLCWFGVNYLPTAPNSVHTYSS